MDLNHYFVIAGHGQEGGSIAVKMINSSPKDLQVVYLELLPWYLRLYFHPSHSQSHSSKLNLSLY